MRALLLLALVACRHTDYAYAHTITGTVVDGDGKPVAGASVVRLSPSGAPDRNAELYQRTTDPNGRFEFHFQGLGPKPNATDAWVLRASAPTGEAQLEVVAPWACGSGACPGYHADVVIRLPTAWQARCLKAFEAMRDAAAAIEPELRTAEVKLDDAREEVVFSAMPPIQHVPALHVFVAHAPREATEWQRRAEALGGALHIMLLRSTGTYDAAISLDGWENARAQRLEPVLQKGAEACF